MVIDKEAYDSLRIQHVFSMSNQPIGDINSMQSSIFARERKYFLISILHSSFTSHERKYAPIVVNAHYTARCVTIATDLFVTSQLSKRTLVLTGDVCLQCRHQVVVSFLKYVRRVQLRPIYSEETINVFMACLETIRRKLYNTQLETVKSIYSPMVDVNNNYYYYVRQT